MAIPIVYYSSNDFISTARASTTFSSCNNTYINSGANNIRVALCNFDYSLNTFAASNTTIVASNSMLLNSKTSMNLTSDQNTVALTADYNRLSIKLNSANDTMETIANGSVVTTASNNVITYAVNNATFVASNNAFISASNNAYITSCNNMLVSSCNISATFDKLDGLTIQSACNFDVAAGSNVVITANNLANLTMGQDGSITSFSKSNNLNIYAWSNVLATANIGKVRCRIHTKYDCCSSLQLHFYSCWKPNHDHECNGCSRAR